MNSETPSVRKWPFFLLLLLGIAIAFLIFKSRPVMQHSVQSDRGSAAGFIVAQTYSVVPAITGFGEVVPDTLLDQKAEVSGKVVSVHPQLQQGAILQQGTEVVILDDKDYELALKQAQATLSQSKGNLRELELALEDARINLQLVQDRLAIAEAEMQRSTSLLAKGAISQSGYDAQRSALIQQQQEVQNLKNTVRSLPLQIEVQRAQVDKSEAEVATQQRNLERTRIRLPFTGRVTAVSVEANQYMAQGISLFKIQTIDRVKVNAQFALGDFRQLAESFGNISFERGEILLNGETPQGRFIDQLGLSATLHLAGLPESQWQGQVDQISSGLDPASRTLGVTVVVDDPYRNIQPGVRPPLVEGMYMEIELRGLPVDYRVVPRSALHEGQLYLLNQQNRLQRRTVKGFPQGEMLLLGDGLAAGEQVISSDLFPVIEGMVLSPYPDASAQAAIERWVN